jgi:hypothetical protein
MKPKKSTLLKSALALVLILLAYRIGYYRGYWARGPVVHFEPDTTDVVAQAPAQVGYEPYFTKVNEPPKAPKP